MKKHRNKYTALLVCLLLTVAIAVSGTIAYLFTSTDPVVNTFVPVTPGIEIPEYMHETIKENATIQNTGDVDSYLRAKIVVTWQNDKGEVYHEAPELNIHYTMQIGANWVRNGKYYYYTKVTAPGQPAVIKDANGEIKYGEGIDAADMLIVKAEVISQAPVDGYTLHIEILGQAIQADPKEAVMEAWGINITSEGYVEAVSSTVQGGQGS